ncbi:hypothetical protein Q6314_26695, partial [Klebsiella pneumoniae]
IKTQTQTPPHNKTHPLTKPTLSLQQPINTNPQTNPIPTPNQNLSNNSTHNKHFLKPHLHKSSINNPN